MAVWLHQVQIYHRMSSVNIDAPPRGARKAGKVLREQYYARRVAVFGSLLHETCFTEWSDLDIAAWGIPADQTFRAIGTVMDLDSSFEINLVDVNTCSPSLLQTIEEEAVDL